MRRSDFGTSDTKIFSPPTTSFGRGWHAALRGGLLLFSLFASSLGAVSVARATPAIVVDAATGDVLYAEEATQAWYPASLTKLMTFYVTLSAVRDHKISFDTPIVVSARAARAAPSKMGFKPGTELTLGNALEMLMVKSANDLAVAVAEAVSGSVEAFAEDMNATAAKLGMQQSHFENPNGLPNPDHVSSAHDLAVLALAIYKDFPKEARILDIGALRLGDEIIPNHNTLLGRYPGVDGMKTGFTCAAGFNLVASADRQGRRIISVVLGAPTVHLRMLKTAVLLDRAFDGIDHPIGKLSAFGGVASGPAPDMHNSVCRRRGKAAAQFQAEINRLEAPLLAETQPAAAPAGGPLSLFTGGAQLTRLAPVAPTIGLIPKPVFQPVDVYVGPAPGYQGPVAEARPPHSPVGTPSPPQAASAETPKETQESTDQQEEHALAAHHAHKSAHLRAMGDAGGDKVASHHHHHHHVAAKHSHSGKHAKTAKAKKHHHQHLAAKHGHKLKTTTKLAAKAPVAHAKSKSAHPAAASQ